MNGRNQNVCGGGSIPVQQNTRAVVRQCPVSSAAGMATRPVLQDDDPVMCGVLVRYTRIPMDALFVVLLFVLGAIVASFVGVVVARLHTGQSILLGRSRCDACGVPLSPLSLIPIASYVIFCCHARCCGTRLSLMAPFSEALLGSLFVVAYLNLGLSVSLLFFLLALSVLLALVLYDLMHQILPPSLLIIFVATAAASSFEASFPGTFLWTFLVAVLIGGSLAAIHFFSQGRAMGLADAPLSFGLALLVGPAAFSGFIFSFWIGAVIGIVLLARRPLGSRMNTEVPFAPFLAAGFLLAYFTQWNPFILLIH